jgi:gliding motility-associated-like protein
MKKNLCLFLILFGGILPVCAQTPFQKNLPNYLDSAMIRSAPDGQSVYVVRAGKATTIYLMRLDGRGNLLWQRAYSRSDRTIEAKSMETVSDGVLLLVSDNIGTRSNGTLMKLNTDGNLAWSYQVGATDRTRVGEIKKDGAENIWLSAEHVPPASTDSTYSYLIQLDRTGSVLFGRKNLHHYFASNPDEIYNVTNLLWNPLISSMVMIEDFGVPYNYSHIISPNRGRFAFGLCSSNRQSSEQFMDIHTMSLAMGKHHIVGSGFVPTESIFNRSKEIPAIFLADSVAKAYTKIKTTQTLHQVIHSQNGDIVFYEPIEKILTKYDTTLTPIWTKKFDNCYITKVFAADVAADGSIYTVRNINSQTIVSRILPSGTLGVCADYNKPPAPVQDLPNLIIPSSLSIDGFYNIAFPTTSNLLRFDLTNPQTTDYCFKLDASFGLPDTVCVGTSLKPSEVDTTSGLRHAWRIFSEWKEQPQPTIDFTTVGRFKIFHSVENTICTDTTSRYITVVLPPKISVGDTIVCGGAKLTVNLTDKNASRYFLNGAATAPVFDISQNGTYAILLENQSCKAEKSIKVKIVDFPTPIKPNDSIYCSGVSVPVVLTGRFENIFWDNKPVKDTFFIRDAAKHDFRATYSLDKDCVAKGIFSILRKTCSTTLPDIVFVPTAFSPNGDNANEVFEAYPSRDATILSLMIYNRWGNLVFQSTDGKKAWDGSVNGQAVPPDVYVYWLQYRDKRTDKVQILSGDVTLMK